MTLNRTNEELLSTLTSYNKNIMSSAIARMCGCVAILIIAESLLKEKHE